MKINIKSKTINAKRHFQHQNYENALKTYSEIVDFIPNHQETIKQIKKIIFNKINISSILKIEKKDVRILEDIKLKQQFYKLFFLCKYLIKKFPKEFILYNYLSTAEIQINKIESALESLENSLKLNSENYETNILYINLVFSIGMFEKAEIKINSLLKLNYKNGYLHRLLSRIKKYDSKKDNHIIKMKNLFNKENLKTEDRINIGFALSNSLEKLNDFDEAFNYCIKANDLKDEELQFDFKKEQVFLKKITEVFTKEKCLKIKNNIKTNKTPIFVLGMPRSGTTLVEQILSSNSDVYGGGELPFLENFILRSENKGVLGVRYPTILSNPNAMLLNKMFFFYIKKLELISKNGNFVTDKLTGNYRWLGLLKATFNNSKIIHVKRNPLDNCYSIYKSYFTNETNGYAYNQKTLGQYYLLYEEIMSYWKKIFGDEIFECKYEDLVYNPEKIIPQLSSFCGLEWDPKMLEFHKNKRRILTVSATQVRKQMYTSSIELWKKNEKNLKVLIKYLKKTRFY